MGCHSLLQGFFPTQESNQGLLHCRCISLLSEPPIIFCKCDGATHFYFYFFTLQPSLWDFGYLAACGGVCMQLLQGFQFLLCVHRSHSPGFRIFVQDTSSVPILGTRVSPHQASCLLTLHVHGFLFHLGHSTHRSRCPSSATCSHVCPTTPPSTSVTSPWYPPFLATPTPHFPCQERSNYTEISTEKDRLLLWHQRQGSCKSGAAAATASGHCAGCRGALTSVPHFAPSLPSCSGL